MAGSTKIVIELGVNHAGSLEDALGLLQAVSRSGADAITIQLYDPRSVSSDEKVVQLLESWKLPPEHEEEFARAAKASILDFGVAIADEVSLKRALKLEPSFLKTVSGDLTNLPLLKEIQATGIPHFLSSGGATLDEVERVMESLGTTEHLILMHTTVSHPTPPDRLRLGRIGDLRRAFPQNRVGYCDHSIDPGALPGACLAGAKVVMKYLTSNRENGVGDYRVAAEPSELGDLIASVRRADVLLGEGSAWSDEERTSVIGARKAAYTASAVRSGAEIGSTDIVFMRPGGDGISPLDWDALPAGTWAASLEAGTRVLPEHLRAAAGA